jgi:hypothetical protein
MNGIGRRPRGEALRRSRGIVCLTLALTIPAAARAQSGVSIWAGLGYSSTEGNVTLGKSAKQAGVQWGLSTIPLALRGDVLLFGGTYDIDALSYDLNGVVEPRVGAFQPYGIVGFGSYATSLTSRTTGWNYGLGVLVGAWRFRPFAEYRRHAPAGRSVTVVGVTFLTRSERSP